MDKVFHFTKLNALESIIKNNSFRVSSVNKMNDIDEFENMQQIKKEEFYKTKCEVKNEVVNIYSELFGEDAWNSEYNKIIDNNLDKNNESINMLNEIKDSCYIGSFSMIPNEYKIREYDYIANVSSMWSHYADEYNGVCIVFNQNKLNKFFCKSIKGSAYKLLKGKLEYKYFYDYRFIDKKSNVDILKEKYFVKNYSWNIENEFRYLFYNKNLKLKNKKEFLEFKGVIECIDSIILSPNIDIEKIKKYEETFEKIKYNRIKLYLLIRDYNSNSNRVGEYKY